MPVIVRELVLTVKTTDPVTSRQPERPMNAAGPTDQQLLREAVEEAIRIVNDKKER